MLGKPYLRKVIRATILTALVCLLLFMLSGCGQREDSLSVGYPIEENQHENGPKDPVMLEREARVLEMLIAEGLFGEER